jgi:hypothetical protein
MGKTRGEVAYDCVDDPNKLLDKEEIFSSMSPGGMSLLVIALDLSDAYFNVYS